MHSLSDHSTAPWESRSSLSHGALRVLGSTVPRPRPPLRGSAVPPRSAQDDRSFEADRLVEPDISSLGLLESWPTRALLQPRKEGARSSAGTVAVACLLRMRLHFSSQRAREA